MRKNIHRACLICAATLLAACAQQARRPAPAPVVEDSKPNTVSSAAEQPVPTPSPKPKPKPKPVAAPKPETKDTDVAPLPEPPVPESEGIERSQVGYYFDTLQGRLRQLVDPAIVVTHTDGHITVDVTRRVHFESDDAALPAVECNALTPIAKALVEYRMTRIVADVSATGIDDAALKSAKTRAAAITQCLAGAGIASRRLSSRQVAMSSPEPRTVLRIEPIVK
jgi:outer membrane protein OmpA-like peptidoglycan-associated protein